MVGERPSPPEEVRLAFSVQGREPQFAQCRSVLFVVDGQPLPVARTSHDSRGSPGAVMEWVHVRMPVNDFLTLANGSRIEGRICDRPELPFGTPEILALRNLASRMAPRAPAVR
jgi:hypothetical protein